MKHNLENMTDADENNPFTITEIDVVSKNKIDKKLLNDSKLFDNISDKDFELINITPESLIIIRKIKKEDDLLKARESLPADLFEYLSYLTVGFSIEEVAQMVTQNIIEDCLNRWESQDDKTKKFSEQFREWIAQIPDDTKPIIYKLLESFEYYTHSIVNNRLIEMHLKLITENVISDEDTIYTYIKSNDGISNSSNDYWCEYKLLNKVNNNLCYENIKTITIEQWKFINNIVFIDDCSGSGSSFKKYIKPQIDILRNKNIYFISIHNMKQAIENIMCFANENKINIKLINAVIQGKAFLHKCFGENGEDAKSKIINTSKLLKIPKCDILGFKESESLMAFYNNTPNNTLGIFRCDTEEYKSIFPRRSDIKPKWQIMKKQKEARKMQNYNSIIRSNYNG